MAQINPMCKKCPLHKTTDMVCISGEGPEEADIFVVGEAPGREEEREGRPFVGESGTKLRELVEMVNLANRVRYENVCRCRPPENRTPRKPEITKCMRYLDTEIELRKPHFIVLLGATAIKAFTGDGSPSVAGARNIKNWEYKGAKVIATYHPAAPLWAKRKDKVKSEELWKKIIDDFLRIQGKEFLDPAICKWTEGSSFPPI